MKCLFIGLVRVFIGLGFIFYWAYPIQVAKDLSISEALDRLGGKSGTLYFKPGNWNSTDKMVSKVVPKSKALIPTITWLNCIFQDDPPLPYRSWSEFCSAPVKQGVTIRATEPPGEK